MKCKSCEVEINPKWQHAINSNICPFCGETILDENVKNLFTTLQEVMELLQAFPNELQDWLLSNFNFIRTDSPNIINYVPEELLRARKPETLEKHTITVKTDKGDEEVVVEKTQSQDRTDSFFARAEAVKPRIDGFNSATEKTERVRALANKIKKEGSSGIDIAAMIQAEKEESPGAVGAGPGSFAEMERMMLQDSQGSQIMSSIPTSDDGEEEIPSVVAAMANMARGNNGGSVQSQNEARDLMKLQQLQNRTAQSRQNFQNGENRGKGGFSRV